MRDCYQPSLMVWIYPTHRSNPNYPSFVCSTFQFPTPRTPVPIHNEKIVDWNKPETNGNGQKLC